MESYKNDKSVREIIINIAEEIENENLEKVTRNFLSFLCDASTDSTKMRENFGEHISFVCCLAHRFIACNKKCI